MNKLQVAFLHQNIDLNTIWMDSLSGMGELEALVMAQTKLAKIDFDQTKSLKEKIDLVLEIDNKTNLIVKKITYKYLSLLRNNRDLQSEIQNATFMYQRQLYSVYTQFFDFYENQTKVKFENETLNLVLARLLNAAFTMAKWRYFDDQSAPVGTWENVHKVIKAAENLSVMNTNLFLYQKDFKEKSIASILECGFMLSTLHKGNYSHLQIQLSEQVLKIWAANPLIVNGYKQDRYQFCLVLEKDRAPERMRVFEKFADYRFWKTTRLVDLIEAYLCAVDMQKSLESFGLEKIAPTSEMVKLFKKLRVEWCVMGYQRQRRKETRLKTNKVLQISHGLTGVCQSMTALQTILRPNAAEKGEFSFELKAAIYRKSQFVYSKQPSTIGNENWWLVDESARGFAVDLGKEVSRWVEAGKLIGYPSPEDQSAFSLAEIKSVRKLANGSYRAGIEVVSKQPHALQVSRIEAEKTNEVVSGYLVENVELGHSRSKTFDALLINPNKEKPNSLMTLIMPRNEYKRGTQYRVTIDGEDKVVLAGRVISKQRDWIRSELLI